MKVTVMPATMTILSRYVKKNALFAIITAVVGLWLLQLVFGYLGELENLSDSYTLQDALRYILYRSPKVLEETIPTGALLGAVVGLGMLASKSELTVMQASGVSKFRIVFWALQPAVIFVLLAIALNQFVIPTTSRLADLASAGKSADKEEVLSVAGYWSVQPTYQSTVQTNTTVESGKNIIFIDYADTKGNIGMVKRWHLDNQGNLQAASLATHGSYLNSQPIDRPTPTGANSQRTIHQWQLHNINEVNIQQTQSLTQYQQDTGTIRLPIEPESIYLLTRDAETLSLTQLLEHQYFLQDQGKRSLEHELAFWQKLLRPFAILSLVVIACSFVFGSLRTHSLGLRVVVSLIFGLFFSYMQDLAGFISLSTGWSPLLMVFIPILLSAILGLWLLQRRQ